MSRLPLAMVGLLIAGLAINYSSAAVKEGGHKFGGHGPKASSGGGAAEVPPPPASDCLLVDTGNCLLVDAGDKLLVQ